MAVPDPNDVSPLIIIPVFAAVTYGFIQLAELTIWFAGWALRALERYGRSTTGQAPAEGLLKSFSENQHPALPNEQKRLAGK